MLILRRARTRPTTAAAGRGRRIAGAFIVVAGLALAAQAPINAGLGDEIGGLEAALVNFVVGSIVLGDRGRAAPAPAAGVPAALQGPATLPAGGLIGAVYVTASVLLVRTIGAGGIAATTITGQLASSVALDRAGALGLDRRPLTPLRVAAVGLLIAGTCLIVV